MGTAAPYTGYKAGVVIQSGDSTDPSTGGSTTSFYTTTTDIFTASPITISGHQTYTSVTEVVTTILPTVVPISPHDSKSNCCVLVGAVVTILILVALFYSRRKRRRSSSVPTVNTSLAPQAQEKEAVQYSGFASLLPIQGIGGWDVPPIAASASAELALDPFADPVPMPDEPFNASPVLVVPPLTREVYDVSVPDPFVDPPALVATSEEELPSRLSKASSYDVPNPRASVTSSNVGRAM
ncbi:hypothetical protein BGW80DRAFT_1310428 [Lactifluus volemus]|nr:hypothetical protein BGW80DRAFT_1310428 [Lactifluus volemus]